MEWPTYFWDVARCGWTHWPMDGPSNVGIVNELAHLDPNWGFSLVLSLTPHVMVYLLCNNHFSERVVYCEELIIASHSFRREWKVTMFFSPPLGWTETLEMSLIHNGIRKYLVGYSWTVDLLDHPASSDWFPVMTRNESSAEIGHRWLCTTVSSRFS